MTGIKGLNLLIGSSLTLCLGIFGCNTAINNNSDNLTPTEQMAIESALKSVESINTAANTGQNLTDTSTAKAISTNSCPAISGGFGVGAGLTAQIGIDFGTNGAGCDPLWYPGTTCSGSASAEINASGLTNGGANFSFNKLTCGEDELNGSANLAYGLENLLITLEGDWDLDLTSNGAAWGTDGTSKCTYQYPVTTVVTYDGTTSSPDGSWNLKVDEQLLVSIPDYGVAIPYSGILTLSGTDIRTVSVKFNTSSPEGVFEVSVGGLPYKTYDINDW